VDARDKYPRRKLFVAAFTIIVRLRPEWGAENAIFHSPFGAHGSPEAGSVSPPDDRKIEGRYFSRRLWAMMRFRPEDHQLIRSVASSKAKRLKDMKNEEDYWEWLELCQASSSCKSRLPSAATSARIPAGAKTFPATLLSWKLCHRQTQLSRCER